MVIGKDILHKLKQWLSPPDTSTNFTLGLRAIHEETATWFLEGHIFQEWHSTGSLLWINGKCTSLQTRRSPVPDGSRRLWHHSGLWEEHSLVRHFYSSVSRQLNVCY